MRRRSYIKNSAILLIARRQANVALLIKWKVLIQIVYHLQIKQEALPISDRLRLVEDVVPTRHPS